MTLKKRKDNDTLKKNDHLLFTIWQLVKTPNIAQIQFFHTLCTFKTRSVIGLELNYHHNIK
jgi:hypothetical protein